MRLWRAEFLWLALVTLLFVLAVWWFPGTGSLATDSYSVSFSGKKALYQTLRRLEPRVSRSIESLIPPMDYGDRLLILGPARSPTAEEWDALFDEVAAGASLVYASSSSDPYADAGVFGARVVPFFNALSDDDDSNESDGDGKETTGPSSRSNSDEAKRLSSLLTGDFTAETELIESRVDWKTQAGLEFDDDDDWDVLVSANSQPQVARQYLGAGTIVLVASDEIFSNQALVEPDRALLAYRIIESAHGMGRTWIDETLNSSGVPKVLGILFDPKFRPLTLQLLLIVVLFGWSGSYRFGPAEPSAEPPRRSIVEHAEALGILYYRAGAGGHAVKAQFEFLKQGLRQHSPATFRAENAQALARQTGLDEVHVRELLAGANVGQQTKLSNAAAGRLLRRLAELAQRLRTGSTQRVSLPATKGVRASSAGGRASRRAVDRPQVRGSAGASPSQLRT